MKVKSTKELSAKNISLKVAVYGPSGSGKTTFGSTFPSPIFLDTDGGLLSIRGKQCDYIELKPPQDKLTGSYLYTQWWQNIHEAANYAIASEEHESIIVDSMTGIGEAALGSVQIINKRSGKNPNFDDWNAMYNRLRDFVVLIRNSNKHVLFIAHEQLERNEPTGRIWYLPAIQGQMRQKFANLFDEFYHATVIADAGKARQYKLLTASDDFYTGKSRIFKDVQNSLIDPDFNKIIKMIP